MATGSYYTYYSTNGETWSKGSGLATTSYYALIYVDGLFMTIGYDGGVYTSANGKSWTKVASTEITYANRVAYG